MRKLAVFLLILFFDFSSKYWVAQHLPPIDTFSGFPFGGIALLNTTFLKVSIVHTTNTGMAWGFLANFKGALLVLRILITLAIFGYLAFSQPSKRVVWSLILILVGAIGNILDFFLYGHVVDMISLIFYRYSYPIFNIADASIFLGVVGLLLSKKIESRRHAQSN